MQGPLSRHKGSVLVIKVQVKRPAGKHPVTEIPQGVLSNGTKWLTKDGKKKKGNLAQNNRLGV